MLKSFLCLSLSLSLLGSRAYSEDKSDSARNATANALHLLISTSPTQEDIVALARLGDLQGARNLIASLKNKEQKSSCNWIVGGIAADAAFKAGNLKLAEKEILSIKDRYSVARLWLRLSKKFEDKKELAEARRIAFYAASQTQKKRDSQYWPEITKQLSHLGENAAARRLLIAAQKDLLDPDPLWGSPLDPVIETAAACGFDDIAFKLKGSWTGGAVEAWAVQNRDDIARRYINREVEAGVKQFEQFQLPNPNSGIEVTNSQARISLTLLNLWSLAEGQFKRNDIKATTATFQEIDALMDENSDARDWFDVRLKSLRFYESNGQWALADACLEAILHHLDKYGPILPNESFPRNEAAAKNAIFDVRVAALDVISQPERFDLQQRETAFHRIKPLILEKVRDNPQVASHNLPKLARAQRMMGDSEWKVALDEALSAAMIVTKQKGEWLQLGIIGEQWFLAGEKDKARKVGEQALALWRQEFGRGKGTQLADVLMMCGMFEESMSLIVSNRPKEIWTRKYQWTKLAQIWKVAPPARLLGLPVKERHLALLGWGDGLTEKNENDGDETAIGSVFEPVM
ncbi:hypothetical protein EON80_11095 [bacterium]|nr:MAG: hypothetical protein EON80_11095 [bacterium]